MGKLHCVLIIYWVLLFPRFFMYGSLPCFLRFHSALSIYFFFPISSILLFHYFFPFLFSSGVCRKRDEFCHPITGAVSLPSFLPSFLPLSPLDWLAHCDSGSVVRRSPNRIDRESLKEVSQSLTILSDMNVLS